MKIVFYLLLLIFGCTEDEAPPPPPPPPVQTPAPTPVATAAPAEVAKSEKEKKEELIKSDIIEENEGEEEGYNPVGKRDPFMPPIRKKIVEVKQEETALISPLQKYTYEDIRITGSIWGISEPKAIIETGSDKRGYVVKIGSIIGKNWGRVSRIEKDKVVIEEEIRDSKGKSITVKKELLIQQDEKGN